MAFICLSSSLSLDAYVTATADAPEFPDVTHLAEANDQTMVQELRSLEAPHVHWDGISLPSALRELTRYSTGITPDHQQIHFDLRLPTATDVRKGSMTLYIVLARRNSLLDLLNYISEQTDLGFKVHSDGVIFLPKDSTTYRWFRGYGFYDGGPLILPDL